MLLGSLALFSCNKENDKESACIPEGAVMLSTEGFRGDEKTSVSDNSVQWTGTDESIRFYVGGVGANEQTLDVSVIGDNAFVPGITGSGAIRGYYPVSIITANDASDHETAPTVVVPDSYDCRYVAGRQEIALPMVASAASGAGEIEFKHVTAAVKVLVKNETGFDLTLDKVVVSSSAYKLSGTVNTTLADNNLSLIPQAGSGSVTVRFTDAPTIAAGGEDIKEIQVPILPIGESQLTIEVYTHSKVGTVLGIEGLTNANYDFHYSCTPEGNTPALGRNHMATARIALKRAANTASPATMTEIDHSLFTVNGNGGKVRFSKGNLQYIGSADSPYWKFAEHQYDVIFDATAQASSATNINRDLYGWGTWNSPNKTSKTNDYSWTYDWGHNPIYNGGNTADQWRTLSANAWDTVLTKRTTSTTGLPNSNENIRFTMAKIGGNYRGMIVFPDNYIHPQGSGFTAGTYNNNSNYTATVSLDGWALMEEAGAIFLPATGVRKWNNSNQILLTEQYNGYYWSCSSANTEQAKCVEFSSGTFYSNNNRNRNYGMSVRLVRNAN